MKHLIVVTVIIVCLYSCKKDQVYDAQDPLSLSQQFFANVQQQLKDSLSTDDYSHVNFSQLLKSKDVQSNFYFLRIGLLNKSLATDFILLQTDSLGNVRGGKLIHVDKEKVHNQKHERFNGSFTISTLNRKHSKTQEVVDGRWKLTPGATAMAKPADDNEPAGEQTLPEVVVTSYTEGGGGGTDWYFYGGLYSGGGNYNDESGYNGGGGGYTYGAAGSGSSDWDHPIKEDNIITIETEFNDDPSIDCLALHTLRNTPGN